MTWDGIPPEATIDNWHWLQGTNALVPVFWSSQDQLWYIFQLPNNGMTYWVEPKHMAKMIYRGICKQPPVMEITDV